MDTVSRPPVSEASPSAVDVVETAVHSHTFPCSRRRTTAPNPAKPRILSTSVDGSGVVVPLQRMRRERGNLCRAAIDDRGDRIAKLIRIRLNHNQGARSSGRNRARAERRRRERCANHIAARVSTSIKRRGKNRRRVARALGSWRWSVFREFRSREPSNDQSNSARWYW